MGLRQSSGADTRARTGDLFITNELLYQLSHIGNCGAKVVKKIHSPKLFRLFFLKNSFLSLFWLSGGFTPY